MIALLVPANLWFCPYIKIYTSLLDEWNVDYEIIFWDKSGTNNFSGIAYTGKKGNNKLSKLFGYYRFAKFIKNKLQTAKYEKIIVFSSQIGIFCSRFLREKYNKKYIFDFRDLSIEQVPILNKPFKKILAHSYANVISSPGFRKYLPQEFNYLLSHNCIISEVQKSLNFQNIRLREQPIDILTIGGIRDYEANAPLMDSIGNNSDFFMRFIGKGPSLEDLKEHADEKSITNIEFQGYYDKEDEKDLILSSTFMNIFYPDLISHQTALSNRFYNSIIYRRPMIVTKGQIQGNYCEKYNLGVAISDVSSLPVQLKNWLSNTDLYEYENNCIRLLKQILMDYSVFEKMLKSFCKS